MLQGMSAVIASPPSVKASFLKGICVRAITSFSGNMLYKHKDNFFFFFFVHFQVQKLYPVISQWC